MKLKKKTFLICMILLVIFSIGIVYAEDNATLDDNLTKNPTNNIVKETSTKNIEPTSEKKRNSVE